MEPPGPRTHLLSWLKISTIFTFLLAFLAPSGRASKVVSDPFNNPPLARSNRNRAVLSPRFTDEVSFDDFSLSLQGQRIFLYSGEFHTYRLPVPDLWIDILEKVKAAGLNGVSVYTLMAALNPSRGVVDFDDWRALQPLFDAAKEAGIWITLRPGPVSLMSRYINAESTAGGIAHWITTEIAGQLRTNASDYTDAWMDYILGIIDQTSSNQITEGGPVILLQVDNEYNQAEGAGYFAELETVYRNSSIVIPLTYNDPGEGDNFINGTGAVDLYGFDSYPQGFDCSTPETWNPITTNYHSYHESANPSQPLYIPEFQGGSFDAWGPTAPGYPQCEILTGPDFQSVFNRQLWASNAKLTNFYMIYGGTSWGGIPFPCVYTSYDYGSTISENRALTDKHLELKLQGIFLRSSSDFYKTNWVGDSSTGFTAGSVTNPAAFVTLLQNPDSGAGFWVVRQSSSTSTATTNFKLNVTTASGDALQIPLVASTITLSGRESKVLLTDYGLGSNSSLLYSTAQVFFSGAIGTKHVVFLYGPSSQEHEFAFTLSGTLTLNTSAITVTSGSSVGLPGNETVFSIASGFSGLVPVFESDALLVLFADSVTATTFFSPVVPAVSGDFPNYWGLGTNDSVLVGGPYLVRSANISTDGTTLALRGDLNTTGGASDTPLTIVAPASVTSITWNGDDVSVSPNANGSSSILVGTIPASSDAQKISIPVLSGWKFNDSLPEILSGFDDSAWAVANHTTTNIPVPMKYGDGKITYGCDYGFCENIVLWRGHFNATGAETSVNLSINGGEAFAASVWLNDVFLNTSFGNSTNDANSIDETDQKFIFPEGAVLVGQDNVITVVQDNMGLDETSGSNTDASKSPRGITGYALNSGNFTEWKVQGKVGGYTGYLDKVRGVLNEGGLFGERQGWHLPGFDTSSWESRNLSDGLPESAAGVGFFVTTFELGIPGGFDVLTSFTFEEALGQPYRVYLFVNGWMMGKRVGNLGQFKFPVHQGILDYNGTNTVAVALWAMEPDVTVTPQLQLTLDGVFSGGVGTVSTNNPLWSLQGRV
ncbi:glycoside hydrolase family 35 protein [Lentinula aff. lateritia]|uniref:Glycoside hydrolase family 35 protein n=1 Tax=Lentinula aff. lateritia TaxID=2804960 RepID=A0ACC1UB19_9AGAR|nr:glycoside hydrolase family 35 protein [Lentinula aff. lateritia]